MSSGWTYFSKHRRNLDSVDVSQSRDTDTARSSAQGTSVFGKKHVRKRSVPPNQQKAGIAREDPGFEIGSGFGKEKGNERKSSSSSMDFKRNNMNQGQRVRYLKAGAIVAALFFLCYVFFGGGSETVSSGRLPSSYPSSSSLDSLSPRIQY